MYFLYVFLFLILESMLHSVNFSRNCPCCRGKQRLRLHQSRAIFVIFIPCGFASGDFLFSLYPLGFEMFNFIQYSLISRAVGDKQNPLKYENSAIFSIGIFV